MEYSAFIYYKNTRICKITYSDNDVDSYKYIFEPIYNSIELLSDSNFRGIPGIDLSLRLNKYERINIQPVFIFERNYIRGKKNFKELQRVGNKSLLEFLTNSSLCYFGDKLTIRSL
jgi:hypothetical protein